MLSLGLTFTNDNPDFGMPFMKVNLEGFDFPRGWASHKLKFDRLFDMLDHCGMGWGPREWIGSKSIKKEFLSKT